MADKLITKEVARFLLKREFINIATADFQGRPSVAPKFLLKIEDDAIYLIDYVFGRTLRNLKQNPRVSISTVNLETLVGYQLNGTAAIIESGQEYKLLLDQMRDREIELSTRRMVDGIHREKAHASFEIGFPDKVAIFRIKVEEIVKISASGKLERRKLEEDALRETP